MPTARSADSSPPPPPLGWQVWIDRGGTFTDLVARSPAGELVVRKLLSQAIGPGGDPAVAAIRSVLGLAPGEPIPAGLIQEVRLGTTVATNALLERRGAPTLLLVNAGFSDLLRIGDQHRPDLFALAIERPEPLQGRVIEVGGRLAADGRELQPLQLDDALAAQLRQARADGYTSVAVALLHAYRQPCHERQLGAWLEGFGFATVVLSHRVSPLPRLVPRAHTTVVEAYLAPVLGGYLEGLRAELGPGVRLRVMQSSGALIAPELLHAKDTILSGPAGGLVGAERSSAAAGETRLVGFDMGGTSTDVCYVDGPWERRELVELAGFPLQAPMLNIHTVAAGGGSRVCFDGLRLAVGPESAGAEPGPACYRRGGPATITDANLLLGRLQPGHFPALFGPGGDQPLDRDAARAVFAGLAAAMAAAGAPPRSLEQLAEAALAIAIEHMAEAIRRISIQQGHDLRRASLCCFGGAAGQHACALAEVLGMERILLPPLAGVLSAWGIGMAEERQLIERTLRRPLGDGLLQELLGLRRELLGDDPAELTLWLRTPGSDVSLPLPWQDTAAVLVEAFAEAHRRRYGYRPPAAAGGPLELVLERISFERITAGSPAGADPRSSPEARSPLVPCTEAPPAPAAEPAGRAQVWLQGGWRVVPVLSRDQLRQGEVLEGPALIVEATATHLLQPHWRAVALASGALLFERQGAPQAAASAFAAADHDAEANAEAAAARDPVLLELYNHRFMAIAEQMGARLQQTSASVNIKERLDFSCALFDGAGALVANAQHIPVHLGSMGESVAALRAAVARGERPPLEPGDSYVSNDPYNGGTHLPDLTVITPVFAAEAPLFFVASRGHHADVGGSTPGSMPSASRSIAEEGLLLDNVPLLRRGAWLEDDWRTRLAAGPLPVRNPEQLLADLRAQLAANQLGVERLQQLVQRHGLAEVRGAMAAAQDHAAACVLRLIDRLHAGESTVELDDGSRIAVAVRPDPQRGRLTIDFSGTSPQQSGNLNAPLAVTKAVVLYGLRCLVGEPIPLNAGCFRPIELVVPEGSLLHPRPPAAVVGGNVETSQAAANALFAALGVQAAAQGTMNNLSFGDGQLQYYETLCGGTGAGIDLEGRPFAGADAVHSHMTNSRLTDPEILEERFPVRLERFAIRRGSGGVGRWPGGAGVVRQLRFLAPFTVSLLSGCRRVPPAGLAGGGPGACGRNRLLLSDGRIQELPGSIELAVEPGTVLSIETPGGGGYGDPAGEGSPAV